MYSVSTSKRFQEGASYRLPRSSYTIFIGEQAEKLKIEVTPEIKADDIAFTIDIDRSPLVERKQTYAINNKGLLTSAKTEDTGKLPEILTEAAKSIVAVANPAGSIPKANEGEAEKSVFAQPANQLSPAEYEAFIQRLTMLNYTTDFDAGVTRTMRIPDSHGDFILYFKAPTFHGEPVGEAEIRSSLKKAGKLLGSTIKADDDRILANGVIARPLVTSQMDYKIYVTPEALNEYRQSIAKSEKITASNRKSTTGKKISEATAAKEKLEQTNNEVSSRISDLKRQKTEIEESSRFFSSLTKRALKEPRHGGEELAVLQDYQHKFQIKAGYWSAYGKAVKSIPTADAGEKELGEFTESVIDLNVAFQSEAASAQDHIDTKIAELQTKLTENDGKLADQGEVLANENRNSLEADSLIRQVSLKYPLATKPVPLIANTKTMSVIDEAHAQLIPMHRNLVGQSTNTVTLLNGVVTDHQIEEKSEALGVVSIPLSIVRAIFSTTAELWKSQGDSITNETAYIEAQAKLVNAKAALEKARAEAEKTKPGS